MEYIIIKDNINDLKNIENLEKIEIPNVPNSIIEILINDYKFMKKFHDYKRDATLALLNIYNAIIVYDDNFNLNIEKNIKTNNNSFYNFFQLIKSYSKKFTEKSLNFYSHKFNDNFKMIDKSILGPIIEKIFHEIYMNYIRKFTYWNDSPGIQNDYINIELKNKFDVNNIRYYWHFQGILFIQDTKYDSKNNGNSFKIEINGKPKFEIVLFNLNQLKYLESIEQKLKQYIDIIDKKIIEQNFKNLNLDFDF